MGGPFLGQDRRLLRGLLAVADGVFQSEVVRFHTGGSLAKVHQSCLFGRDFLAERLGGLAKRLQFPVNVLRRIARGGPGLLQRFLLAGDDFLLPVQLLLAPHQGGLDAGTPAVEFLTLLLQDREVPPHVRLQPLVFLL